MMASKSQLKFSDVFNSLKGTGAIEDQKPAEKRQRTTFSTSKLTRVQEWCDQSFRTVICSKRSDGRRNMKQCVDNRSNLAKQRSVLKAAENKSEDGSGVSDAIDNGAGVPELQSHSRKSVPALSSNLTNRRSVLNEAENQSEDGSEWLPTESDFSDDVDNDSVGHESQLESRKSFPALSSNVAKQRSVLNEAENKSEDGSEWLPSESDISGDLKNDSVVPDSHSQSDLSDVFPVLNQVAAVTVDTPQEKYKWDKKHCCLYCKKMVNKMSRHLTRKHKNELDVQKAQHFPINSKERRQAFINILHEGDYEHNYDVYRTDTGEVIPKYRKANRKPDDFVACSHCKGLYLRQLISKHYKRCPKNHSKIKYKKGEAARVGKMMLPVSLKVSTSFYHDVIGCMRSDDVSRLVKGDSLILKLGERLYGRRDVEEHTAGNVSSCLRILGRLVEILRRKSEMDVSSLLAGLDPVNFDLLISCIKELAGFEEATHSFQKPSVALKLGYALKKCSKIVVAEAGKYNDRDLEDKMLRFDRLIDGEWYDAISACASQSASMSKMNVPKLIPSLADVGKVNEELKKDLVSDDYGTLAKASLGFISIFNRKRGGELQRMKHDEFKIHGSRTTPEQEVLEGLSKAEKKMANILSRMEIKGKFVRPVPILLTPEMIQCLEKLLQLRKENNVVSKYMFARQSGYKPYRGSDVIRHYAMKAKVENPSIFTATSLRKQLATLSQAMEISKLDQDQLAGFLGHDIRVHRNVYRRPMEVMQKAKVASILFKINRGIEIPNEMKEDNLEMEEVEDEPPSADLNLEGDVDSEVSENYDADSTEINREEPCTETVCTNVVSIQRKDAKNSSTHKSPKQQCQKKPRTEVENRSTGRKSPKHKKKPWTEEEISAVKEHLLQCISMNKVPQKYEAEKARTRDRRLSNRTWKDIKYYVYNLVKKQRC